MNHSRFAAFDDSGGVADAGGATAEQAHAMTPATGSARRLEPPAARSTRPPLTGPAPLPSDTRLRLVAARPTVVVADRQRWVGEAIGAWLQDEGFAITATVSDECSAVEASRDLQPGFALLDIELPPGGGVAAGIQVATESPSTKVIVLSTGQLERDARRVRAAGLFGCISKEAPPGRVLRWLRTAASCNDPPKEGLSYDRSATSTGRLTSREQEILQMLGEGASGRRIAATLGISHHTVRTHIQNILGKLNVRSRIEAVAFASTRGLIGLRGGNGRAPVSPRLSEAYGYRARTSP